MPSRHATDSHRRSLEGAGLPTLRSRPGRPRLPEGLQFAVPPGASRVTPRSSTRALLRALAWTHIAAFVVYVAVGTGFTPLARLLDDLHAMEPAALQAWWQGPPCTPGTVRADGVLCELAPLAPDVIVAAPPR
jgi:hypothetical protein